MKMLLLLTIFAVSVTAVPTPGNRHQAIVDIAEDSGAYRGKIHVNGNLYDVNLEQTDEHNVFTPSFRLTETIRDPSGTVSFRDVTPSEGVTDLERSIFVDKKTNSVFRILNDNGRLQLHGIMDNVHISNDGVDHFAIVHGFSKKPLASDYFETNLPLTRDDSIDERGITKANPELYVTVDYKLWTVLGQSEAKVLEYMAIMVRAVNNVYSLVSDPEVKFKIVGSTIMKSRFAQPFLENNRNDSNGKYNQWDTLFEFASYMFNISATLPGHDLSPVLSGEQYSDYEGLAMRAGACVKSTRRIFKGVERDMTYQISIIADQNGVFIAVHTLTHELAHSLGAPHDANHDGVTPDFDTGDCPWDTGYIMTYTWKTENQFLFSVCSKRTMKKYLSTKEADCVREDNAPGKARPPATKNPGAVVSMDRQCAVRVPMKRRSPTGQLCSDLSAKAAWDEATPDELCSTLTCICPGYRTLVLNERVLEGTPCRKDGTGACRLGKCV